VNLLFVTEVLTMTLLMGEEMALYFSTRELFLLYVGTTQAGCQPLQRVLMVFFKVLLYLFLVEIISGLIIPYLISPLQIIRLLMCYLSPAWSVVGNIFK
jgi:hypothetical protein